MARSLPDRKPTSGSSDFDTVSEVPTYGRDVLSPGRRIRPVVLSLAKTPRPIAGCRSRPAARPAAGFRPVRLLPSVGVSVQLPGGTQLVVPTTDAESLRLVIDILARVDADRIGEGRPC